MSRILVDTSVLVQTWRKDKSVPAIATSKKAISSVTYIEFLQGAKQHQKIDTLNFLARFEHIRLDPVICDKAIELINLHSQADGLRLADSLIAATSLIHNLDLLTLNRRHFQRIADLKLI